MDWELVRDTHTLAAVNQAMMVPLSCRLCLLRRLSGHRVGNKARHSFEPGIPMAIRSAFGKEEC